MPTELALTALDKIYTRSEHDATTETGAVVTNDGSGEGVLGSGQQDGHAEDAESVRRARVLQQTTPEIAAWLRNLHEGKLPASSQLDIAVLEMPGLIGAIRECVYIYIILS